MQNIDCQGRKIPFSLQFTPARTTLPCTDQAVICPLIHRGTERKNGELNDHVEENKTKKFR